MAVTKRKRVSKKNKKSWRKNVDIEDVEEFLEDQRLEERTGFKVSELKNDDLFEIDVKGQEGDTPTNVHKLTKDTSFRLREVETPKGFQVLVNKSAVSDPLIKRNRIKTREEKRHPVVKKQIEERLKKGILTVKQKTAIADRKKAVEIRKNKPKPGNFTYDLWCKEGELESKEHFDWLSADTVRHTLSNTGNKRKHIPRSITTKTSLLPAIEDPHPGLSYNPSLKDHNSIINLVVEKEKSMVDEEKHLKRVTTDMFSKVEQGDADKEYFHEMSIGLTVKKESDDESVSGDYSTVNPPVKNKKKTLQKRRRLREASRLKEELRRKKVEKKKISDLYRLRKFNAEFKKRDNLLKKLKEKRKKLEEMKPFETKTLSHTKYEEPLMDFNTIDELCGNLRGIKTNANLLKDRFKSLQKRNILEPTLIRFIKKAKRKRYERENTKMGWESKGY